MRYNQKKKNFLFFGIKCILTNIINDYKLLQLKKVFFFKVPTPLTCQTTMNVKILDVKKMKYLKEIIVTRTKIWTFPLPIYAMIIS